MRQHKIGILLAAFGASSRQGEEVLQHFEALVRSRFPAIPVRWAFTSPLVRERLAQSRKKADSVDKALHKMIFEGYTHLAVQPLHLLPGLEYANLAETVTTIAREGACHAVIGAPLLTADDGISACSLNDCAQGGPVDQLAQALLTDLPSKRTADEGVIFVGHGTRHEANACYAALAQALRRRDARVFVGTINDAGSAERLLPELAGLPRIWLLPLLAVVGRHAREDMAGDGPESWRSRLERAGLRCETVLRGLVEHPGCAALWTARLADAMARLERESE